VNRISIAAFFAFFSFALISRSEAEEIKFETADGKLKIAGTVGYYVANGKPVESPKGDEKGLAVVIIRPDGKPTNPVPIKTLSGITKRKLFSRTTASENKILSRPPIKNSIGMELKLLPAGTFMMGSNFGQAKEQPVHKVTLSQNFYIGVHEVTQEQWTKVMGTNPASKKGPRNAVERVSWTDAVEFCLKLSGLPEERAAGRIYQLPTEAQWEYACRAGTTTEYSFGDDDSEFGDYAWFGGNSGYTSHPVGGKKPNAWGLYDMHGNVWEWCQDWLGGYPSGMVRDPTGPASGSAHQYRFRGPLRVYRGGSWFDLAEVCRSASRCRFGPSPRFDCMGFRVSLSPSGE